MATVGSVADAIVALRSQITAAGLSTQARLRALGALDQFTSELRAAGVDTATGVQASPSATSASDAANGLRQQVAGATFRSAAEKIQAAAKLEILVSELRAQGLVMT